MNIFCALFTVMCNVAPGGPVTEDEFVAVAVTFVSKWEGVRTEAYLDTIANPPVWTICAGHTGPLAEPGAKLDKETCAELLRVELVDYRRRLHAYLTSETKQTRLTPYRDTAYVSLAYNVGVVGAGGSTAVRRLNEGNIAGGCEALTWWNKAGGRVIRGLVRRRAEERQLCLAGLDDAK